MFSAVSAPYKLCGHLTAASPGDLNTKLALEPDRGRVIFLVSDLDTICFESFLQPNSAYKNQQKIKQMTRYSGTLQHGNFS